jgi:hypothetical protein
VAAVEAVDVAVAMEAVSVIETLEAIESMGL